MTNLNWNIFFYLFQLKKGRFTKLFVIYNSLDEKKNLQFFHLFKTNHLIYLDIQSWNSVTYMGQKFKSTNDYSASSKMFGKEILLC